ncbi:MAG: starvation-inducible DNA-binding protein [Patiriisocius sp.]|jgi:starvation-inducible DNA-binding protein
MEVLEKTKAKETKQKRTFMKLGFSNRETDGVVEALNLLLSNYQVHYQKLRDFHWNVKGPDFFDLHNQFEIEYNAVKLNIDEVAERIRVFGKTPTSTLKEYLEHSTVEEVKRGFDANKMVSEVLNDFETLAGFMFESIEEANKVGDTSTADLITKMMKRMEKRHWMFTAFSQKN